MELRLAEEKDLPELKIMYNKITEKLKTQNIELYWSEHYPYGMFAEDIKNKNLYVLLNGSTIVAAFGIFDYFDIESRFEWSKKSLKTVYIGRLGTNVDFQRQGLGTQAVKHAEKIAKEKGANFLRIFVVDGNIPAMKLYEKNGYTKVNGISHEYLEFNDATLTEFAYEKELN